MWRWPGTISKPRPDPLSRTSGGGDAPSNLEDLNQKGLGILFFGVSISSVLGVQRHISTSSSKKLSFPGEMMIIHYLYLRRPPTAHSRAREKTEKIALWSRMRSWSRASDIGKIWRFAFNRQFSVLLASSSQLFMAFDSFIMRHGCRAGGGGAWCYAVWLFGYLKTNFQVFSGPYIRLEK